MSPRNWIRAAVVALGLALIIHGTLEILRARNADAAPRTAGSTDASHPALRLSAVPAGMRTG